MDPRIDRHPRLGRDGSGDGGPPPTVRQVFALAAALCEKQGEEFPETRDAASELIERLRYETGHPTPRLEDVPRDVRPRTLRRRRRH